MKNHKTKDSKFKKLMLIHLQYIKNLNTSKKAQKHKNKKRYN